MCKREVTLGEEIIGLAKKGIDIRTVERMHRKYIEMYRKYIEMTAEKESKEAMEAYCINDVRSINECIDVSLRVPTKFVLKDAMVGHKTTIKLNRLGTFTATVHKVTADKVMLIFDDYVTKRHMNESGTNNGGFEESDLNKWLYTDFIEALPYSIRTRLTDVTIPTVGEMFGWDNELDRNHFEADNNKQLPLMRLRRNRVAYYNNECEGGWLRNATKNDYSSNHFAFVGWGGNALCDVASGSRGVRPEIWLVK